MIIVVIIDLILGWESKNLSSPVQNLTDPQKSKKGAQLFTYIKITNKN